MEHGKDYPLYALRVRHHAHRSGSPSHFSKGSLDQVGGSQPAPELGVTDLKETQQLIEVLFQTPHGPGISPVPSQGQPGIGRSGLALIVGVADSAQRNLSMK